MSTWQLRLVARTPQETTAPVLEEISELAFTSLTWVERLRCPSTLDADIDADTLDSEAKARLVDLAANPCELLLRRDGVIMFAGPVVGGGGDRTITLHAPDLTGYLAYMAIIADTHYQDIDQHLIAADLIDQWQTLDFGNFGIDTSAVTPSGVTRTVTWLADEHHAVLPRIHDLGDADDGFDWHITPDTRALTLHHPQRGADVSDDIVLTERNIASATETFSVAAGDFGSDAYGTGTSPSNPPLTTHRADTTARQAWGRSAIFATFDGVYDPATLDSLTDAHLATRTRQLFVPGPALNPVADCDVEHLEPGNTIGYRYTGALGPRTGTHRIATRTVTVDEKKIETLAVTFL